MMVDPFIGRVFSSGGRSHRGVLDIGRLTNAWRLFDSVRAQVQVADDGSVEQVVHPDGRRVLLDAGPRCTTPCTPGARASSSPTRAATASTSGHGPLAAERDRPALSVRRAGAARRPPVRGAVDRDLRAPQHRGRSRSTSVPSRSVRRTATSTASSRESLTGAVHAHVWTGGADAWVWAVPMDGSGPGLGLQLKEGELWAYSVESREPGTSSNVRGHLYLHVTDHARAPHAMGGQPTVSLAPNQSYRWTWQLAWYDDLPAFHADRAAADRRRPAGRRGRGDDPARLEQARARSVATSLGCCTSRRSTASGPRGSPYCSIRRCGRSRSSGCSSSSTSSGGRSWRTAAGSPSCPTTTTAGSRCCPVRGETGPTHASGSGWRCSCRRSATAAGATGPSWTRRWPDTSSSSVSICSTRPARSRTTASIENAVRLYNFPWFARFLVGQGDLTGAARILDRYYELGGSALPRLRPRSAAERTHDLPGRARRRPDARPSGPARANLHRVRRRAAAPRGQLRAVDGRAAARTAGGGVPDSTRRDRRCRAEPSTALADRIRR